MIGAIRQADVDEHLQATLAKRCGSTEALVYSAQRGGASPRSSAAPGAPVIRPLKLASIVTSRPRTRHSRAPAAGP
jgi:hypothetical protein